MPSDIPLLFGEIGLELGFFTADNLEECIGLQEEATFHRHIGSILLEQKHISFAQLNQVLKVQKDRLAQPPTYSDLPRSQILFGRLALTEKMATEKQLNAALREQAKLTRAGTYVKIGQVLQRISGLSRRDIEKVLYTQGKAIFACPRCQGQYNIVSTQWSEPPDCFQCNVSLEGIEQPADANAWDDLDNFLPMGAEISGAEVVSLDALETSVIPMTDDITSADTLSLGGLGVPEIAEEPTEEMEASEEGKAAEKAQPAGDIGDAETLSLGEIGVPDIATEPTEEMTAFSKKETLEKPPMSDKVDAEALSLTELGVPDLTDEQTEEMDSDDAGAMKPPPTGKDGVAPLEIPVDTMQQLYDAETLAPQQPSEMKAAVSTAGEDEIIDLQPRESSGEIPLVSTGQETPGDTVVQGDSTGQRAEMETITIGDPDAGQESGDSEKRDPGSDTVLQDGDTAARAAMETINVGPSAQVSDAVTMDADAPEAAAARSAYIEKKEEVAFGKVAKEKGFVDEDQVLTAFAIREERSKMGAQVRLSEIMIEDEMITPEQLQEIMAEQEKYMLLCPGCSRHYPVSIHEKDQPFTCPDCSRPLAPAEKAAEVMSAQETIDSGSHFGTLEDMSSATKYFEESRDLTTEETREIRPELLFGKVALEYGFTTRDRVIECAREQETVRRDRKIGEIMVEKGYLSDEEVATILDLQRKSLELPMDETKQRKDQILFGRLLIAEGLITEEQLRDALKEKTRREQLGQKVQLGQILVEGGFLTVDQAQDMLFKQGKEILICPKCFTQYNVRLMDEKSEIRCKIDGTLLTVPTHLRDIAADSAATMVRPGSRFGTAEEIDPRLDPSRGPDSATAETIRFSNVRGGPPSPSIIDDKEELSPSGRKMFERYEILGELARGGMGIVYRAVHPGLKKVVALKVLLAGEAATEDQVRRFHQEAESAAKLKHPNIVPIHDVGIYKGKHYFTLEFIEGKTLRDKIREERIPVEEAVKTMKDVCDAIDYAHIHGIIHRDLKPANIMIDHLGNPQVMDFGLAKNVEGESRTITGVIMGTPAYMPPEQAEGKISMLEARSDVYSLGAVFYECLTGAPPFEGANPMEIIKNVIEEDPAHPRTLNVRIPKDVETICLKAMEKDIGRRYATAGEMRDDIGHYLNGDPIMARPQSFAYKASKWIKKRKGLVAAVTIILLLIAGGATWFGMWQQKRYQTAVNEFDSRMRQAKQCVEEAVNVRTESEEDYKLKIDKYDEALKHLISAKEKFDPGDSHRLQAEGEILRIDRDKQNAEESRNKFTADKNRIRNADLLYKEAKIQFDSITDKKEGPIALWREEEKKKADADKKKLSDWRLILGRGLQAVASKASSSYDQLPDDQKKPRADYKALAFDANKTLAEFELRRLQWDTAEYVLIYMQAIRFDNNLEGELTEKQKAFNVSWENECNAISGKITYGRDINKTLKEALDQAGKDLLTNPQGTRSVIENVLSENNDRIRDILKNVAYETEKEKVDSLLEQADIRQDFLEAQRKPNLEVRENTLSLIEPRAKKLKSGFEKQRIFDDIQNLLAETRRALFQKFFQVEINKVKLNLEDPAERQRIFNSNNQEHLGLIYNSLKKAREYVDETTNSRDAGRVDKLLLRVENALAPHEGMAYVDAGTYYVGTAQKDMDRHWITPAIPRYFSGFYIGVNEVTNNEFLEFVKDGGYENTSCWRQEVRDKLSKFVTKDGKTRGPVTWDAVRTRIGGKSQTVARPAEEKGTHPVTGISFYEADAFCTWKTARKEARLTERLDEIEEEFKTASNDTKTDLENEKSVLEKCLKRNKYRLPDELEWEVAARGDSQNYYPWGSFAPDFANIAENGQIVHVGKFMNKDHNVFFNTHNMAGNAFEWTTFNPAAPKNGRTAVGVIRGGSVGFDIEIAERFSRIPNRKLPDPFYRNPKFGFRIACNVPNYFTSGR
ncbi:MAG: protein kinase domain-containing protein [Planctomycetota bacterium]